MISVAGVEIMLRFEIDMQLHEERRSQRRLVRLAAVTAVVSGNQLSAVTRNSWHV